MNRTTKRTIVIICAVVLLIAALLCFTPWPTRITMQTTGMETSKDGTYLGDCKIRMEGWKLNYLFQEDSVKFEVFEIFTHSKTTINLNSTYFSTLTPRLSTEFDYGSWMVYFPRINQLNRADICLGKNADWFVVTAVDRYFVAAADANADLQAYWEMCADQIQ